MGAMLKIKLEQDHVQNLVVKLRAELNALKSGNNAMKSISEEPPSSPIKSSNAASPAMLELQDRFADLSQKYAKLTAEMAKRGDSSSSNRSTTKSSLSPEDFAAAVEPRVCSLSSNGSSLLTDSFTELWKNTRSLSQLWRASCP